MGLRPASGVGHPWSEVGAGSTADFRPPTPDFGPRRNDSCRIIEVFRHMLNTRVWLALVGAGLLTSAVPVLAQRPLASIDAQRGVDTNPYSTPEDVTAGKKGFDSRCAVCHGPDGRGNRGPDLTRNVYRHGNSDRAIFMNILSGIPGTGMPSIRLSDREMWQIVAYVATLRRPAGDAAAGDAAAGRALFARHDCGRCHFVDGVGGRLGPDLSAIGWSRSAAHLRASVVNPADDVEDNHRQILVTDHSGGQTRGVLRNEDAYSILLLDTAGRLRAFSKSDLQSVDRPEASLMPSFAGRIPDQELDDLVAYLSSLRRE